MNKLFANHEIRQFQKELNIRTFEPSDVEFEIGPNLIRCRHINDVDFLIEPDQKNRHVSRWVIA